MSFDSGREGHAEAEDPEVEDVEAAAAAVDLDLTAVGRVSRTPQAYSHDVPCADARRLEQTTAGMQHVALEWRECAAGGWNRPSRTYPPCSFPSLPVACQDTDRQDRFPCKTNMLERI